MYITNKKVGIPSTVGMNLWSSFGKRWKDNGLSIYEHLGDLMKIIQPCTRGFFVGQLLSKAGVYIYIYNPTKWNHLIPRSLVAHCRTVRPGVAETWCRWDLASYWRMAALDVQGIQKPKQNQHHAGPDSAQDVIIQQDTARSEAFWALLKAKNFNVGASDLVA